MVNYEDAKLRANAIAILYQIGAIKFEKHILASGEETPIYVDMRLVISSPEVLQTVATLIWRLRPSFNSSLLCGVPYTALTLATCISLKYNIPMVLRRKELQGTDSTHAIKVEGLFTPGQTCLVINDIVSSGKSILETAVALEESGLIVREALVFLDRRENETQLLGAQGIKVSSVFTIPTLVEALITYGKLSNSDLNLANKVAENLGFEN
ncbi:Orotate phosphoribosyltransferase,orotate phosphoribosyltransferase,orotate phosphoribosyltransferase,Phosphoribosyl transferase domain [Chlamydia serpentis]|uniref:Orotate phosphoribosyltransferase n=1 Tax=Chlamydia serpentis TaxID=1967782 RepID=A0A2R8FBE0_9CHLA|nr:orotate phosphoribosyltransferase [Chlamydia serpentis]SPN73728.1 Orotate phosphoribosyltransferase,orotate phosphoribosyltransferase,orotate phosphoribosyltransferase,Phosphoribosyl transferase domain [Chlamydia serpentis]